MVGPKKNSTQCWVLTNFTVAINVNITWKNNRFTKFLTGEINQYRQNHLIFHIERVDFFCGKTF